MTETSVAQNPGRGWGSLFRMYPLQWRDTDSGRRSDEVSPLIEMSNHREQQFHEATPFVHGPRPRQDGVWWWLMVACTSVAVLGALVAHINGNPNFSTLVNDEFLKDPANCPEQRVPSRNMAANMWYHVCCRIAEGWQGAVSTVPSDPVIPKHGLGWAILKGWGYLAAYAVATTVILRLCEAKLQGIIKALVPLMVSVPIAVGLLATLVFKEFTPFAALTLLGLANSMGLWFWRDSITLLGQLASIACRVIAANPSIFWITVLLQAINMALASVNTRLVLMVNSVGSVVANPQVLEPSEDGTCVAVVTGLPVPCCHWQTSPHMAGLQLLLLVASIWVGCFLTELGTFMVAGIVTQWYYTPASVGSSRRNASRSARHARSSLGTLALAGPILTLVSWVRFFTYWNDRPMRWWNPITWIARLAMLPCCCACWCISARAEHLTRYATHRAAISGHPFFRSSGAMHSTLRRNHLNAIGIGWFSGIAFWAPFFTMAYTGAQVVVAARGSSEADKVVNTAVMATSILLFSNLSMELLLEVINSLYVCFAFDREQRQCTRADVHATFTKAPFIGPIWDDAKHARGDGPDSDDAPVASAQERDDGSARQPYVAPIGPQPFQRNNMV